MHVERRIADNLAQVRGRIAAAAERAGHSGDGVTLVAVTKYVPAEIAAAVVEAGCTLLAESRPQDLWSKAAALVGSPVQWHMIGHLQRNKIRRTLPLVALIQSVDSSKLLAALDQEAELAGRGLDVLLEVNISGEITKTGIAPGELEPIVERAATWRHLSIRGLMGMAGLNGRDDAARRDFARLRALRDMLSKNCPPNVSLAELSMGMSGDFEIAIEEGATMVRVGSALFEGIEV
jgi:hypothetical protein